MRDTLEELIWDVIENVFIEQQDAIIEDIRDNHLGDALEKLELAIEFQNISTVEEMIKFEEKHEWCDIYDATESYELLLEEYGKQGE